MTKTRAKNQKRNSTAPDYPAPDCTAPGKQERSHERGGALVEFSVVILLILTLIFSAMELTLSWGDTLTLDQSTRSAARVGARMTNDPSADREILRSFVSSLDAKDMAQIDFVVIYEAAADGSITPSCLTTSGPTCNRYPVAALSDLGDDTRWECGGGAYDASWCPTVRQPLIGAPVNLGVYVEADRAWITGVLPGPGIPLKSDTVMRLDPLVR